MLGVIRAAAPLVVFLLAANMALAQEKARVVVVNYPLQYFAERLLGGATEVVNPIPDGVDPSFWRPSIADISSVQAADLILLNGAGFSTWTTKVSLPRSKLVDTSRGFEDRLIAIESITHSHGDGEVHSHGETAFTTWIDPQIAIAPASEVNNALSKKWPGGAQTFAKNFGEED